ncbi:DNA-binding MarR family transcriptional regulator [Bradyrhizobium japonicum]|uniref:MarR family winged helix-turn-helix transcriptional regulator n=1 Tax=Bradyrhizobium TaxID=374 RepID=UPI0004862A72|nr:MULTISPECIES: MarR family transcriptional regulator [Bradyrhizobium]MBR0876490.1 MarR family transcriptional regulator [Bradyrhizobium liaoningense]MBR0942131.1 MarR family transcriptional regulator [Bradyrhizobium liaoningense]MBR0996549.1 MarR family transcriptional regulator [Bradyrhizobium liaoningense]MBR1027096.1 MarR family transcriptional regulator [Bradyrhizobium liaoningense]MBR1062684.1 MarR family transcriptional regulator [Bradyrhizobium liaoningense]
MSSKTVRPGLKSDQQPEKSLDLRALRRTPGFMLRLAQLKFFEGFYEEFAALGLTPATYAIFAVIRDNPGVPPSSLASLLRLRLPNLIKILNELESSGFIKRSRSKADRRAVELMLTPKGAKLIAEGARLTEPYNEKMLAPLSAAEQRALLELLNRLLPL